MEHKLPKNKNDGYITALITYHFAVLANYEFIKLKQEEQLIRGDYHFQRTKYVKVTQQ